MLYLTVVQTLRDLFRQLSSGSSRQELKISSVYVVPGHIFVATTSKDGIEPKGEWLWSLKEGVVQREVQWYLDEEHGTEFSGW